MRRVTHLPLIPRSFLGLRLAGKARSQSRRVLIVGAGPLARATADDIEDLDGRTVLGHLTWDQEHCHAKLRAPVLGSHADLARCLSAHEVAEVYIAGTPQQHGDAIADSARICEQYGVRFAVPAIGFRLTRARPRSGAMCPDGYVHFAVPKPSWAAQELVVGLRQLSRVTDVLWIAMMVLLACVGIRPVSPANIANASMD